MKTYVRWTVDEIATLKKHPFDVGLAALFPRHMQSGIESKRRRLGIYMTHEQRSCIRKQCPCSQSKRLIDQNLTLAQLSNQVFQVLIGSILGDE